MRKLFNETAKQLKDVWFYDTFFALQSPFNFYSNRFYLFDMDGYELNAWHMEKVLNVTELPVLEQKISNYAGYGVGFNTLHIKLMFKLDETEQIFRNKHFTFGMEDRRG